MSFKFAYNTTTSDNISIFIISKFVVIQDISLNSLYGLPFNISGIFHSVVVGRIMLPLQLNLILIARCYAKQLDNWNIH